jgi:hypothetical protein
LNASQSSVKSVHDAPVTSSLSEQKNINNAINNNFNNLSFVIPNKKLKTLYTPQGLINLSASYADNNTKDSIANLDLGPNIPTPEINKLLAEYLAADNGSNLLKTPGSALAILTPNTSNSLFSGINVNSTNGFNSSNLSTHIMFSTPSGESSTNYNNSLPTINNTTHFTSYINPSLPINSVEGSYAVNQATSTSGFDSNLTALTPSTVVNPNCIFGIVNSNGNNIQLNHQSNINNNPIGIDNNLIKYATLTTVNENSKFNNTANNSSPSYVNTDLMNNKMKDELQTVPVHPQNFLANSTNKLPNKPKKSTTKIRSINDHNQTSSLNTNVSHSANEMTSSELISRIKKEPKAPSLIYANNRRDTENSIISNASSVCSNSNSSSTFSSLANTGENEHDDIKIEKKRERNRLAAQKCRTRKLEKIETLEKQVKTLTDANEMQRNKSRQLLEEISQLKQKFDMHQKLHNCDLKIQ